MYTPTRFIYVQRNTIPYYHISVQQFYVDILENPLQWLDDMLFPTRGETELLNELEKLFSIFQKKKIR